MITPDHQQLASLQPYYRANVDRCATQARARYRKHRSIEAYLEGIRDQLIDGLNTGTRTKHF